MSVQITLDGQPPKYLTAPSYTLGRAADCDVLLPEGDGMVSRHHARLERDPLGAWWLVDTSTNGTFVNGQKLNGRRALQSGDQIGIGRTQIGFLEPQATPATLQASATSAPSRAAETSFVTRDELQAKLDGHPAPVAPVAVAPVAAAPVPVASPAAIPSVAPPVAAESQPPVPVAPPSADVVAPAPKAAPAPRAAPANNVEATKQCTRCRHVYAYAEDACPACGHTGFKVKSATAPTSLIASSSATLFDHARPSAPSAAFAPSAPSAPSTPSAPAPAPPLPVMRSPQPPIDPPIVQSIAPPVAQPQVAHVVHHVSLPKVKSPAVALVFSFFLCGGGQIYNGQIGKGVGFFLGGFTMGLISLIPFVGWLLWLPLAVLYIFNLVDAYTNAERINAQAAMPSNYHLPQ